MDGAGYDIEQIDSPVPCRKIRSLRTKRNVSAIDREAIETSISADVRHTRRQRGAWRVDETAAVAGDPVRIGDNDVGAAAEHFGRPDERTAILRRHLIEDDRGSTPALKVWIARCRATQLRRTDLTVVVVENNARRADVESVVLVVRQTLAVGSDDIDERYAVRSSPYPGAIFKRSSNFRRYVLCVKKHWLKQERKTDNGGNDFLSQRPGISEQREVGCLAWKTLKL
ncbi:hypothetical protein D3C80_534040 [compost metagenome]